MVQGAPHTAPGGNLRARRSNESRSCVVLPPMDAAHCAARCLSQGLVRGGKWRERWADLAGRARGRAGRGRAAGTDGPEAGARERERASLKGGEGPAAQAGREDAVRDE
eukprot:6184964-Pleurochrysis_carterae.AAC.2